MRDDKASPDEGLKHAQELVQKEKVTATIGFCNSGVAMKALDVFQQNKHVLMVTCATGTAITAKYPPAESFIFRTSARDELQTQFPVDEIVKRGLNKVALLVDTSGYGDLGLKDTEAALARAKLKPHAVVRFKVGVTTLDEEMKQLKASGADSLIGWTVGPEEGVISASRANVGWKVPQFGPRGLSHASAYTVSGGKVDGALMVQTVLPNVFPERNGSFLRNYAKISKESPIGSMMSAAQTYDAVHLLLRAMFDAKNDLTSAGLKKALENPSASYRGVVSTYERAFSPTDHDAISSNMLWLGTGATRSAATRTRKTSAAPPSFAARTSLEPSSAPRGPWCVRTIAIMQDRKQALLAIIQAFERVRLASPARGPGWSVGFRDEHEHLLVSFTLGSYRQVDDLAREVAGRGSRSPSSMAKAGATSCSGRRAPIPTCSRPPTPRPTKWRCDPCRPAAPGAGRAGDAGHRRPRHAAVGAEPRPRVLRVVLGACAGVQRDLHGQSAGECRRRPAAALGRAGTRHRPPLKREAAQTATLFTRCRPFATRR
ncbi:ABC transporter substrate-binding protein [Ramlibacter terrae]|uniref:ABC transporter substrate-binding protein n=1 Tax=Ramlibacter terrae TaxID=2732511 RepID=A0ABX6P5S9_9BURK|nr:ABC transporter substrate-binding protein [Ramlibacter terrae]